MIFIPKKNIYDVEFNPLPQNSVEKIEVNASKPKFVESKRQTAYQISPTDYSQNEPWNNVSVGTDILSENYIRHSYYYNYENYRLNVNDEDFSIWAVACGIQPFARTFHISIPKQYDKKKITRIYDQVSYSGTPNISVNVECDYREDDITVTWNNIGDYQETGKNLYAPKTAIVTALGDTERMSVQIPRPIVEIEGYTGVYVQPYIRAKVDLQDDFPDEFATVKVVEKENSFDFDITIVVGSLEFTAEIPQDKTNVGGWYSAQGFPSTIGQGICVGRLIERKPISLEFSFLGDFISVDFATEKVTYPNFTIGLGNETKSLEDNEWLQYQNLMEEDNQLQKALAYYQGGLQSLSLLCSLDNYYDLTLEDPSISIYDDMTPPLIKNGEKVATDLFGGYDEFFVVSNEFIYDGAPWQRLTLLQLNEGYPSQRLFRFYDLDEEGWTVEFVGYDYEGDVVIPSRYNGRQVARLGSSSFESTNVKSISFPSSIKVIPSYYCYDTRNLQYVEFRGNGLKEILPNAFEGSGIREIVLPKSLEFVGSGAFYQSNISNLFFKGTKSEFEGIEVEHEGNQEFKTSSKKFIDELY